MHTAVDGFEIAPSRRVRWGREEWSGCMMKWDKLSVGSIEGGYECIPAHMDKE